MDVVGRLELACHSKACAPPPVGVGGSKPEFGGDWRGRKVQVQGQDWTLGDVHGGKLYHASKVDLPDGTVLEPGHGRNYKESGEDVVSISSEIGMAGRWAPGGFIYEIEPIGHVGVWRSSLANYGKNISLIEGRVPKAKIIRKIEKGVTAAVTELIAACYTKGCAPPPVGKGGSLPGSKAGKGRPLVGPADLVGPLDELESFTSVKEVKRLFEHDLGDGYTSVVGVVGKDPKDGALQVEGDLRLDGGKVGTFKFFINDHGEETSLYLDYIAFPGVEHRGKGVGTRFMAETIRANAELGVDYVELDAVSWESKSGLNGALTWARAGFDWHTGEGFGEANLDRLADIRTSVRMAGDSVMADRIRKVEDKIADRRELASDDITPWELSESHRELLANSDIAWYGVLPLRRADFAVAASAARDREQILNEAFQAWFEWALTAKTDGMPEDLTAACHSKSCAPPPVGSGGSEDGGYRIAHTSSGPSTDGSTASGDQIDKVMPDVYEHPEYYGSESHEIAAVRSLRSVRGKPDAELTVYRSMPPGEGGIRPGDWVSPSRSAAENFAWAEAGWVIAERKVRAGDIWTDGNALGDFGWHPSGVTAAVTELIAACYDKSCAPPPIGTGGSKPGKSGGMTAGRLDEIRRGWGTMMDPEFTDGKKEIAEAYGIHHSIVDRVMGTSDDMRRSLARARMDAIANVEMFGYDGLPKGELESYRNTVRLINDLTPPREGMARLGTPEGDALVARVRETLPNAKVVFTRDVEVSAVEGFMRGAGLYSAEIRAGIKGVFLGSTEVEEHWAAFSDGPLRLKEAGGGTSPGPILWLGAHMTAGTYEHVRDPHGRAAFKRAETRDQAWETIGVHEMAHALHSASVSFGRVDATQPAVRRMVADSRVRNGLVTTPYGDTDLAETVAEAASLNYLGLGTRETQTQVWEIWQRSGSPLDDLGTLGKL